MPKSQAEDAKARQASFCHPCGSESEGGRQMQTASATYLPSDITPLLPLPRMQGATAIYVQTHLHHYL